jgi:hypothetical protein
MIPFWWRRRLTAAPERQLQLSVTANQAKVLMLLVETMTPERFPGLETADFTDAWAVHGKLQGLTFTTPRR